MFASTFCGGTRKDEALDGGGRRILPFSEGGTWRGGIDAVGGLSLGGLRAREGGSDDGGGIADTLSALGLGIGAEAGRGGGGIASDAF